MFSHTNTTLQGITTIRAFRAEQQFADKFDAYQDLNTSVRFLFLATGQAFALWLEMATVFYMASVVASFMYLRNGKLIHNDICLITRNPNIAYVQTTALAVALALPSHRFSI